MARKKTKTPEAADLPKVETTKRTGSRHKDRHSIAMKGDLYDALAELADEHARPLNWELRLAVIAWLEQHGKWPHPDSPTAD